MPPKTRKMTSTAATVDAVDTSNAIPDATNTASAAPSADILTGLGRAYASHNLFAAVNKPMFDSIMYVNSKAQWNGKAAYDLLGQRYLGDHNACLMTAINQFTAMKDYEARTI